VPRRQQRPPRRRERSRRNAGFDERVHLFGGAAEQQRIAALEADHGCGRRRACSIMSALISSCVMVFVPQRLPTLTISAGRSQIENGLRERGRREE
jgi:hypothetical protein